MTEDTLTLNSTADRKGHGPQDHGPHLANTMVQPRVGQLNHHPAPQLQPGPPIKFFTSPGSPDHTQFYPAPTKINGTVSRPPKIGSRRFVAQVPLRVLVDSLLPTAASATTPAAKPVS